MAEAHDLPEVGGDHPRTASVFLTQSHPRRTESSGLYVGTSLDQIYAQRVGQSSPIPSMRRSKAAPPASPSRIATASRNWPKA